MMKRQQFGSVQLGEKSGSAMLCMDADRPEEAMLHWWGEQIQGGAILAKWSAGDAGGFDLSIKTLYRLTETGSVWAPPVLSEDEKRSVTGLRVSLSQRNDQLEGEWTNAAGDRGFLSLKNDEKSRQVKADGCSTWSEFKDWINESRRDFGAVQFRGQGNRDFRLRTTLHRAEMHRLERWCWETLAEFRTHAEAILDLRIDTNNRDDYSMLLGLAQHHGLPSPLLDWTLSPYIAAFFAFSDAIESAGTRPDATHVRVFALTQDFRARFSPPVVAIPYYRPYMCHLEVTARKNPRLYAQRGTFLVTNISDLEEHLARQEEIDGRKLLLAADIPVACASEALEDLHFMGLTPATLFPGLDGVCRLLRHRMLFRK
jgi:hypothetical protein